MNRRECLTLTTGAAAGAALAAANAGCNRVAQRVLPLRKRKAEAAAALPPTGDLSPAVRLLNRAAFGPAPGDVERVTRLGLADYVDEQLAAPTGDNEESLALKMRLRGLPALSLSPHEQGEFPVEELLRELEQAALLRAVYSPWQLRERMVDFWTNHFNIYARKGYLMFFKGVDDVAVIRKHAMGTFPDLLRASARSPAMLAYLDNQQNRKGVANENYARELLELHTLGVDGGYTQKDVQEVARCLTGWTVEDRFLKPRGTFRFDGDLHDTREKVVLGVKIPAGGGIEDGERVLDIVATHPSTARFLSRKLVRYFYGEEDPALVASTAAVYAETSGDIKRVVRHVLTHPALPAAPPILKRPFDFVVSALRASNAETDASKPLQAYLHKMGQPLNEWPMPDGYPDKTAAWTGSLLARWNFALAFAAGGIRGTSADWAGSGPDELIERLLARRATDPLVAALRGVLAPHRAAPAEMAALVLASPAFQWR